MRKEASQTKRLLLILEIIPVFPQTKTVSDILSALEVRFDLISSKRTIQRDLKILAGVTGICCEQINSPKGENLWFWPRESSRMLSSKLTNIQVLTIILAKKYLTPLLPSSILSELDPFFLNAETNESRLAYTPLHNWKNKVAIAQSLPSSIPIDINIEVKEKVSNSLMSDEQIEISYSHVNGDHDKFIANPMGLIAKGNVLYLVVFRCSQSTYQMLALHRIERVVTLNRKFTRQEDFNINDFIQKKPDFQNDRLAAMAIGKSHQDILRAYSKNIIVKLLFNARSAKYVLESPISHDQKSQSAQDGGIIVTATIFYTPSFFDWLVSIGGDVEIIEPEFLRAKMIIHIENLQRIYKDHC